jgi:hypothetical protein
MPWQLVATDPLDFDAGLAPAQAKLIAAALLRHALPLLVRRDGRAEPLASAALFHVDGRTLLLTCRHIFDDGLAVGDLCAPRNDGAGLIWLHSAVRRVMAHPERDLALIELGAGRTRDELLRHWPAVAVAADVLWPRAGTQADGRDTPDRDAARLYVLAGWPYAQMRRIDDRVYARPVVFFAPPAPAATCTGQPDALRVRYARVARRFDGIDVHAPALDGVSGAMLWALLDHDDGRVLLRPAGVQCAFNHGAYARGEPLRAAAALFDRLRQC